MNLAQILTHAVKIDASDIFIHQDEQISLRINGALRSLTDTAPLTAKDISHLIRELRTSVQLDTFHEDDVQDVDFAYSIPDCYRFRVNIYRKLGTPALVIRPIPMVIPDPRRIRIPPSIVSLADLPRGLVIFTGTTGSGKSTSLACLIDHYNQRYAGHIVTIEDPIEFLHQPKKCCISQREIGGDTESYLTALRAALRQSPNVILVGEMRDHETISAALTAAETGHLVFSTLHTMGASATINRIVDVFPANQQPQVRAQLATTLQAVVSQQLIPSTKGGRVAAFEVMIANSAVRNLIRENQIFQIDNTIQTSSGSGMCTMDNSLLALLQEGLISQQDLMRYAFNPSALAQRLGGAKRC